MRLKLKKTFKKDGAPQQHAVVCSELSLLLYPHAADQNQVDLPTGIFQLSREARNFRTFRGRRPPAAAGGSFPLLVARKFTVFETSHVETHLLQKSKATALMQKLHVLAMANSQNPANHSTHVHQGLALVSGPVRNVKSHK